MSYQAQHKDGDPIAPPRSETAACIIQDLEKRVAELEADQRRLEWLAENEYAPSFQGFIFFDVSGPFSHADTWREAIDAAMEAEQC